MESLKSSFGPGHEFPSNSSGDDLIAYARSLLQGGRIRITPIRTGTTQAGIPNFSPGFIVNANDTFGIILFQYSTGIIYSASGSQSTTSGWKTFIPS